MSSGDDKTTVGEGLDVEAIRNLFLEDHPNDTVDKTPVIWMVRGFTLLSFCGTFIGLRLIVRAGDAIEGFWSSLITDAILAILVALATFCMVYFLRLFVASPFRRAFVLIGYIPLLLFSVMFGFAFYWQRIEAPNQSTSQAQSRLQNYIDTVQIASRNLGLTNESMRQLSTRFEELASEERQSGGTCGDNSPAGPGPRMRHRDRRAAEIDAEIDRVESVTEQVDGKLSALQAFMPELSRLSSDQRDGASGAGTASDAEPESSAELRERIFNQASSLARDVNLEINAIASNPIINSVAETFDMWAMEYSQEGLTRTDDPRGTPYICFSPTAASNLSTAAEALKDLPTVQVPNLPTYGGSAGTREAISRFIGSVNGFARGEGRVTDADRRERYNSEATTSTLNSGDEGTARSDASRGIGSGAQGEIVSNDVDALSDEPPARLNQRDIFPLLIALLVDFLLFISTVIERKARSRMEKARGHIRMAVAETINPLQVPLLRANMKEEEAWRILRPYRFSIGFDDYYVALPALNDEMTLQIRDTLKAWLRLGLAVKEPMEIEEVKRRLIENDNTYLIEEIEKVETRLNGKDFEPLVVSLTREADSMALLGTLFRGVVPGPRDSEAQHEQARGPSNLRGSFRNLFRATGAAAEHRINRFADKVQGQDYSQTQTQEDFRNNETPESEGPA